MSYLSSIKLPNNETYDLRDSRINFGTTDDKFLNHDGTWTSITPEIEDAFGYKSGAGSVVSFNDGANVPLSYLSIDFSAKQDGTPWQSSLETAPYLLRQSPNFNHGYNSEIDILVGGSIAWNQLVKNGNFADTSGWSHTSGITISASNNVLSVTSSANGDQYANQNIPMIVGHKYCFIGTVRALNNAVHKMVFRVYYGESSNFAAVYSDDANQHTFGIIVACASTTHNFIRLYNQVENTTNEYKDVMLIDLTAFNSEIADYVYSLEQATAGTGVAWLKEHFPKLFDQYHAHDTGSLVSVKTSGHRTVGFNQWDEEWELGRINTSTGENQAATDRIRAKNYIKAFPNTNYFFGGPYSGVVFCYGSDKGYLGSIDLGGNANRPFTTLDNTRYIRFFLTANYGTTYKNDICINISKTTGTPKNGDYVAYESHSYPLDSDLELRGIPKLSNGSLYYDGDEYRSDGTVTRKYGIVDLGTLNWEYVPDWNGHPAHTVPLSTAKGWGDNVVGNFICPKYTSMSRNQLYALDGSGMSINPTKNIAVRDYTYTSASDFKTAMSGVYLVYELATPTTEQSISFESPQLVSPYGTEEYVDTRDVPIPVGHRTVYADIYPISGLSEAKVYVNSTNTTSGAKIYTLNLNGTRYGGTIDFLHGVLTLMYGYVNLGTLNWEYSNTQFYTGDINPAPKIPSSTSVKANALCSYYPVVARNDAADKTFCIAGNGNFVVYDNNYSDASSFKKAMSGAQLVYELAEPQIIQLTPTQVMALQGTNYIWSNGDNINLRYTSDSALYLEAMEQYAAYVANETVKKYGMIEITKTGVSSLPITITDSNIRANDKVINSTFSNPSVKITNWNVTTIDGSLTISGTIDGTTDITLDLVPKVN